MLRRVLRAVPRGVVAAPRTRLQPTRVHVRGLVAARSGGELSDLRNDRRVPSAQAGTLDLSGEPTEYLESLLESGDRSTARRLFNTLLEEGAASSRQLSLMMALGGWTSIEMQSLISHSEAAGIRLDVECCNALLAQLQLEGRPLERVLVEMQMVGVDPNQGTLCVLERTASELSRMRTADLRRRLEAGDRRGASWTFECLLESRQADSYQLSVLLAHYCTTSKEMWSLVQRAEAAGISLTVGCCNTLLQRMQLEGEPLESALAAMRSRGIAPGEYTQTIIDRPPAVLSRMRTGLLKRWLQRGEEDLARGLVDRLLARGQLDSHQLNALLAHGSSTSEATWALVERAEAAGYRLDVNGFNALLNRLQHEGQPLEPMLSEMRARRIVPDAETKAVLERPAEELAKMRTMFLLKLLERGELSAARQLFNDLLEGGVVTSYHLSLMMAHGGWSSEEMRALIDEAEGLGVVLGPEPFNTLVNRLQHEGRPVDTVVNEMRSHGLEPNQRTQEVLSRSAVHISRMRTADLKRRLERGELDAARLLFDGLLEARAADAHQQAAMAASDGRAEEEKLYFVERAKAAVIGVDAKSERTGADEQGAARDAPGKKGRDETQK